MRNFCFAVFVLLVAGHLRADPLIPSVEGTTWHYDVIEEVAGPTAGPAVHSVESVRAGRQQFEGRELVKLETLADSAVVKTEIVAVDDHGIICFARGGKGTPVARLDPPQTIIPGQLQIGSAWDMDDEIAGMNMHLHFKVTGEDDIKVAAGQFHAFHLHADGKSLMSVQVDRWFAAGTGFLKENAVVRGPTGELLQRRKLELTVPPKVVPPEPQATPAPAAAAIEETAPPRLQPTPWPVTADGQLIEQNALPTASPTMAPDTEKTPESVAKDAQTPAESLKKLTVEVSSDPAGGLKTRFKSDVPNIYVRWQGHDLPEHTSVRVAWIAEDVGDIVEPNFVIDQTSTTAASPDAQARFTLGRPPDGWAEGKYRVEFYVDEVLVETVRVTITP